MKRTHVFLMLAAAVLLVLAGAGCSARAKKSYLLDRANHWFDSGQLDKAEIEYLNVLLADPQNTQAVGRLGVIYFDEGRFQKAAPFLFKGSQLATNDLDLRVKLAQIYLAIGSLKQVRDETEFVLEKNPGDADAPVLFAQSASTHDEIARARLRLRALAQNGDDASLETALGMLASNERDFQTALVDFRRALALDSHFAATYVALGNLFWQKNELKQAEVSFKAAADCAPPHSVLQLQYGQFEIQAGNFGAAENFFTGLTEKNPGYIPAWLGLAEVALDEKKFKDSSAALNKALIRDPENVDALVLKARLELARSETAKAMAELERLAKLYPQAPRIHYQLALVCVVAGQVDKSLNQLHEAADLDPNFVEANFLLAQLELKTGDPESAVELLRELIARHPDLTQAKLFLAEAYRSQGNFTDAGNIYQQLEKTFPKNARIPVLAGLTFIQQSDEDAARRQFNHALDIDPDNADAQEALAQLDLADGQFDTARQRIEKVISKNPDQARPEVILAKIFLARGQTNEAETALLKATALPEGFPANLLLAQLYFNLKQDQNALDRLDIALAKDPKDTSLLMFTAIVQNDQKNYQAAADTYQKLLAINPQYSPALNNLAWLYCNNLGDLDKAYALAQRARQLLPTDPSTADTLGWVLFKMGQYSSALKAFQESAIGLSGNPEAQFHLGLAYYMLADEDDSRQAFQSARDSNVAFADQNECQTCLSILNMDTTTANAAAQATLEKRISEKPDDPIAFARLVSIYQRDKNSAKTTTLCENALKANPQNVHAMILLAQLCASTDPQKAFDLAKAAYRLKPDDAEVCATLGHMAFLNGNDQWAYSLLQDASQDQADNGQTLFDLANAAFCIGKFSDAQTAMQNAMQVGLPSSQSSQAQAFLDLVALCQNPEQAAAAQSRIENVLTSDPDNPPALFADALVQSQNNNPMGAERAYESLLGRHPDCALAQRNLAVLYAQNLVEPEKAYPIALKAREAFPDDPQVTRAMALILFEQGNYMRAADLFTAISNSPGADARLFYCLGISEYHLKNFMQSKTSLERALDLNLSGQEATDARETLEELH